MYNYIFFTKKTQHSKTQEFYASKDKELDENIRLCLSSINTLKFNIPIISFLFLCKAFWKVQLHLKLIEKRFEFLNRLFSLNAYCKLEKHTHLSWQQVDIENRSIY